MFRRYHILFLNIFLITNKYNKTFLPFSLIHYIFKRWENIIYIYQKNHVEFKYVYLQIIL